MKTGSSGRDEAIIPGWITSLLWLQQSDITATESTISPGATLATVDGKLDFVVFENGTCVLLAAGMSDIEAKTFALSALSDIFGHHPDMNPTTMDDGNVLVSYNYPAVNVVLQDIAKMHWPEIEARHLDGLARAEVLITPLGSNTFDAFGKQALLGRAYMFMDAQAPKIVEIKRHV